MNIINYKKIKTFLELNQLFIDLIREADTAISLNKLFRNKKEYIEFLNDRMNDFQEMYDIFHNDIWGIEVFSNNMNKDIHIAENRIYKDFIDIENLPKPYAKFLVRTSTHPDNFVLMECIDDKLKVIIPKNFSAVILYSSENNSVTSAFKYIDGFWIMEV